MKVIIQIPCYNEEATLPQTLADLPERIDGVDEIEWLVVDDGSGDRTVEVARESGVAHIVMHNHNKGLAEAFRSGLSACLELGADVIVNTDGDNQYPGRFIADLVKPVVDGHADMVIGNRHTADIKHFSAGKKKLQWLGSAVLRLVSDTDVPDAPSGFRALSREAAMRLNIMSTYTYTLETLIQAGKKNLKVMHVPVETNPNLRESRLMRGTGHYVLRSTGTILRLFLLYEPFRMFAYLSAPFFLLGLFFSLRYLGLMIFTDLERGAHIQSVVVGMVALSIGFLVLMVGVVTEILGTSRMLLEEALYYLKRGLFRRDGEGGTESPEVRTKGSSSTAASEDGPKGGNGRSG